MSLDFYLMKRVRTDVFNSNIPHNLTDMADKAGIYKCLWRPDENGFKKAKDIIPVLKEGIKKLEARPEYYKKFDSSNGWGTYEHFVPFVKEILKACEENPSAEIEVSR